MLNLDRFAHIDLNCLMMATAAIAAEPTPGLYQTPSLGGTMIEGRATNSWMMAGNAAMGNGDVWNSMSWMPGTMMLGTQWRFQCAVSTSPQTMQDNRVMGTGTVVYTTNYSGGTFFLSKTGPWGDGVNDLTGTLAATQIITTLQYVQNSLISGRENISASGLFDGSGCYLTFLLSNGIQLGNTDAGPVPMSYPGFQNTDCSPTRTFGSWSDIVDISMQIDDHTKSHHPQHLPSIIRKITLEKSIKLRIHVFQRGLDGCLGENIILSDHLHGPFADQILIPVNETLEML